MTGVQTCALPIFAFAVAINVQPEILIVDEILAVGDQKFQEKCFNYMEKLKQSDDVTIIFVSHNLPQVEKFCTRTIYINDHQIKYNGNPSQANQKYLSDLEKK